LQNVDSKFEIETCNQKLKDLIKMCEKADQTHWNSFCKEIMMRDKFRKNDIRKIIPDMATHLENYKLSLNNRKENNAKV
jgi:hypothetical protein